jgi:hypothetical protein
MDSGLDALHRPGMTVGAKLARRDVAKPARRIYKPRVVARTGEDFA